MSFLRKFAPGIAAALVFIGAGQAVAATVVGATRIEITSAIPTWIQLDEVFAFELGSGINVAASANGGTASATSVGFGGNPSGAIDGVVSGSYGYHSGGTGAGEKLTIDFAAASSLSSLRLVGRGNCCRERDFWNVSIFDASNQVLFTGQLDSRTSPTNDAIVTFTPSIGGVPEPATWAMMILGFGAAGTAIRSRRRTTAVA